MNGEQPKGPVVTDGLFAHDTDRLYRTVRQKLEGAGRLLANSQSVWFAERIRDAYMRGLSSGYAQGVADAHREKEAETDDRD